MLRNISVILIFSIFCIRVSGSLPDSIIVKTITLSGVVTDSETGERLAGVTIIETNIKTGTSTDENGFYSLELSPGRWNLQLSYIGYKTVTHSGQSSKNSIHDFKLDKNETQLAEVIIEARRNDENVKAPSMGIVKLDVKTIRAIPSFLGEIDVVRVLQLLPGVQSTSEGSTGFSVRGGGSDQNLILLDDATVYNSGHMLGFFSIFNNDAVKNVTLYKGDIPAAYGGRLSSLLDVEMKEGDRTKTGVTGSIGTLSSKLTVEGPLKKEKSGYIISGRRTYADLFLPFAKEEDLHKIKLFFWDGNIKLTQIIGSKDRLYFTGYTGKDVFKNDYSRLSFGNTTGTLKWDHVLSRKMYLNLSLIGTRYNYDLGTPESGTGSFSFLWKSGLTSFQPRLDITHYPDDRHKLKYGISAIYHAFNPAEISGVGSTSGQSYFKMPASYALENGIYASDEFNVSGNLTIKYGLRYSLFQNIGPGKYYKYDNTFFPVDSVVYSTATIFNTYSGLEPRFAFTWLFNELSSLKGSYSHTIQYITLAQNSSSGTPLNIWFPASPNIRPQYSEQFSAGYFRNLNNNMYEVSAELYYKNIKRLIDFRDHAELFLNQYIEGEIRKGRGYSYGIETLIRKNKGSFTGWMSYTWSRSFRVVPEINNGRRYPSLYDKPHTVNVVASYAVSKRVTASATWTYATGLPLTLPTGRALIGNSVIPLYSERNSYRMEDYHRMDISVTLRDREKEGRKFRSEFNLSVYNVYNRHNSWAISIKTDEDNPLITYMEKTYLFSVIPAITWNLKF